MTSLDEALRSVIDEVLRERIPELVRAVVREELAVRGGSLAEQRARVDVEYISTAAAARYASVQPETVRDWIAKGLLIRYRAGRHIRVRRDELDALLAASARSPAGAPEGPTATAIATRILGVLAKPRAAGG